MNEEEIINEQFKNLPESLQKAIDATPWENFVKDIALKNNLSLQQISILKRETMLVLYVFDSPLNFINNLVKELVVEEDVAISIAEEVNEKIFEVISKKADNLSRETNTNTNLVPEIALNNLPMVEGGEVAHSVPHVEQTTYNLKPKTEMQQTVALEPPKQDGVSLPDYRYPNGKDPYREPLV